MKILAIETSCDDTGIAILEVKKIAHKTTCTIHANKVHTQLVHSNYGGVFPMMAKREHGKNIIPTLSSALTEAGMLQKKSTSQITPLIIKKILNVLERENDLGVRTVEFVTHVKKPNIDAIAVTVGPGLEPALWVGISMAKALSYAWNIPIIPVNHMEGHVLSVLVEKSKTFTVTKNTLTFPVLSLLVSGGHTELVLMKEFGKYKIIGSTRDDAAGEAFDKVARMLGLPYPGGPAISELAEIVRKKKEENPITLPRPMMHTKEYDFSFSGLKTAVLYLIRDTPKEQQTDHFKSLVAHAFEDAVIDVLTHKTIRAVKEYGVRHIIVGGGVSANTYLQKTLTRLVKTQKIDATVHFPTKALSTDNALMIAIAGYFQYQKKKKGAPTKTLKATGNLSL